MMGLHQAPDLCGKHSSWLEDDQFAGLNHRVSTGFNFRFVTVHATAHSVENGE